MNVDVGVCLLIVFVAVVVAAALVVVMCIDVNSYMHWC